MVEYNVNLESKTVLVTGAAGFIGSNLVKRLFHDVKNIKVIGIDSITDYYDVNIKYERLKEIEAIAEKLIHDNSCFKTSRTGSRCPVLPYHLTPTTKSFHNYLFFFTFHLSVK